MRTLWYSKWFAVICLLAVVSNDASAQKMMEHLDRGVIAINEGDGNVFVGWRLLGTEPHDLGFNVYRESAATGPVRVNNTPLTGPTHLIDRKVNLELATKYSVRAIVNGIEQTDGHEFILPAKAPVQNYIDPDRPGP